MSATRTAALYVLCDDAGQIRYVGISVNPSSRFSTHKGAKGDTHCARWVRCLRSRGAEPEMFVRGVLAYNDAKQAECATIKALRAVGVDLEKL